MKYFALLFACFSVCAMAQDDADQTEFFQLHEKRLAIVVNYAATENYLPVSSPLGNLDAFIEVTSGLRKCYFGVARGPERRSGLVSLETKFLCISTLRINHGPGGHGGSAGTGNLKPMLYYAPINQFPAEVTIKYL